MPANANINPSILTPQLLMKKMKRKLGLRSLPVSYTDQEILEILYEDTLPTFSIYFPATYTMKVDLHLCRKARVDTAYHAQRAYHLDLPHGITVLEVSDLQYYDGSISDYYSPQYNYGDSYDIFNSQIMQGMIESMMSVPIVYRFEQPDILYIDEPNGTIPNVVTLQLNIVHSKDLSTIPFTYLDYLTKLFCLDCEIAFYEDMKRSNNIDTTFNEIDFQIDNWENAEEKREELLEKWNEKFLAHRVKTIYRV